MNRRSGIDRFLTDPQKAEKPIHESPVIAERSAKPERTIEQVSGSEDEIVDDETATATAQDIPAPLAYRGRRVTWPLPMGPTHSIVLEQVIDAIYQSYLLLRIAIAGRDVALRRFD